MSKPIVMERGVKYRDADKMALIPVKNVATEREALLRKPEWMKIKLPADSTRQSLGHLDATIIYPMAWNRNQSIPAVYIVNWVQR